MRPTHARVPPVAVAVLALLSSAAAPAAPPGSAGAPAAELDEQAALLELRRGAGRLESGDAAAAVTALRRAAAVDTPVRDLAWLLLARASLRSGQAEEALSAASRVEGSVSDSVRGTDAAWVRAQALAALERHEEAARSWSDFRRRHGEDARADSARVHEARALEAAGREAEASAAWRRVALEHPELSPDDALDRARRLAEAAGLRFLPPTGDELLARADRLHRAHRHAAAAEAYALAESALGSRADTAMVRRARSLYRLRRNDEASAACVDLARRFPESRYLTACLHRRARVAWRQDDGPELLALTREAAESPRHRGSTWRDDLLRIRAGYFLEKGRWDEAVAAYERLVREHPRSGLVPSASWKAAWARLLQGRPAEAARRFSELERRFPSGDLATAAAFWAALSSERAGDPEAARQGLAELYLEAPWEYHGLRAREELSSRIDAAELERLDAAVEARGVAFTHPGEPTLSGPHGVRHLVLRRLELHDEALDEIEALRASVPDTDALVFELARARSRTGQAARAQALLRRRFAEPLRHPSRRSAPELWEIVYPRPYHELVDELCARRDLDPSLVSALVRSESWWNPGAHSPAGARGLMQLMPATARRMAAAEGLAPPALADLHDPELNLRLGTRYLAFLMELFDGDRAAAVAAYNAGETKVGEWWRAFDAEGAGAAERVDRIPYAETRRYVRKVLEGAGWYRWLAGSREPERPAPPEAGG